MQNSDWGVRLKKSLGSYSSGSQQHQKRLVQKVKFVGYWLEFFQSKQTNCGRLTKGVSGQIPPDPQWELGARRWDTKG